MPNQPNTDSFQVIAVRARDEVLRAIRDRAAADDVSLSVAALDLIEKGTQPFAPQIAPQPTGHEWDGSEEAAAIVLANVADRSLVEELIRRFDTTVGSDDHAAAIARAETAEARADTAEATLASLKDSLKGLVS